MKLETKKFHKTFHVSRSMFREYGFSLIEAVVSVSVFAVVVTSIVGVYLSVQRLNQQSTALQVLQQNGRFLSEDLTKLVRNGQIDYARYLGQTITQPTTNNLYLLDRDGVPVNIFKSGDSLLVTKGGSSYSSLTGNEVRVLDFKAFVWPSTDPFAGGSVAEQPTVTLYVDLESNINRRDPVRVPFEITVSTRQYPE